jgi:RNA polymerase sigma-70 factor, ECF subfamily
MSDVAHSTPGPDRNGAGALVSSLFEQHGRTVYGLCRLLLRDADEAEDAAQQTFLSAYRAVAGGVVPRDSGAWLATIARNECRNRVRSRMREPLFVETTQYGVTEPLEETAARGAEVEALKAALRELPEKQREAVLLRDVYGLRYGEIATAIGATRPAVEALLFRARRRLQGRLRPLRDAAAALLVPAPLRDALAEAIPGFTSSGGGAAAGAAAGLTAAKIATATLLVGTAGTTVAVVGSGSSERVHRAPRVAAPAKAAPVPVRKPVRQVVVPAVSKPVAVAPEPIRATPRRHAKRQKSDDRGGDDRGERSDSSGPGPGAAHELRKHQEREEHAAKHENRGKHGGHEAKQEHHAEQVRSSASTSRGHGRSDNRGHGGGGGDDESSGHGHGGGGGDD